MVILIHYSSRPSLGHCLPSRISFLTTGNTDFCSGFSWDRVNFLCGSWCSAVFWIWGENNIDNILMFLVVARQSRFFQLFTLAWAARCMESGTGTQLGHLTPTGQRDVPYHMTSCSAYKLGELARVQPLLLGDRMGIVHLMVSNCICASRTLYISHYYYYYYYYYHRHLFLCFPIQLYLSQSTSFYFFPFSSPSHDG